MATVKTVQGDTWDILSKRLYGNELFMDALIQANIQHRKTVVFRAGVVLNVPEINTTSAEFEQNLPPWKQSGGA